MPPVATGRPQWSAERPRHRRTRPRVPQAAVAAAGRSGTAARQMARCWPGPATAARRSGRGGRRGRDRQRDRRRGRLFDGRVRSDHPPGRLLDDVDGSGAGRIGFGSKLGCDWFRFRFDGTAGSGSTEAAAFRARARPRPRPGIRRLGSSTAGHPARRRRLRARPRVDRRRRPRPRPRPRRRRLPCRVAANQGGLLVFVRVDRV